MAKVKDFINFVLTNKKEFTKEEIKMMYALTNDKWQGVLNILLDKKFIKELSPDIYQITPEASILPGYTEDQLTIPLKDYFTGRINNPADVGRIGWDTIKNIDKFKVYPGEELKIYEIHLKGKIIKLEGKDIMDVDIFILKLFETFGIMLPKYKNLNNDWAQIVSYWMQNYGEVVESHQENISANTEAVDSVVSYINHAVVSDDYIVKDGFITYKNGMLYVPTKSIKKLLKREDLFVSLRKLAYYMKDYLISGSVPLKVENKSERFWKLNPKKFEVQLENEIKLEKEPDTGDEETLDKVKETSKDTIKELSSIKDTSTTTDTTINSKLINEEKDNVVDNKEEDIDPDDLDLEE